MLISSILTASRALSTHGRDSAPGATMTPAEVRAKVLEFTRRPFAAVAAVEDDDGKGARLLEPGTGKELRLRWDELAQVEEKQTALRSAPYLVLAFQDGRQVALADVGFAFAPSTAN